MGSWPGQWAVAWGIIGRPSLVQSRLNTDARSSGMDGNGQEQGRSQRPKLTFGKRTQALPNLWLPVHRCMHLLVCCKKLVRHCMQFACMLQCMTNELSDAVCLDTEKRAAVLGWES